MKKVSEEKRTFKRFDPADLKPLTNEQKKILFPNPPTSMKKLKQLKNLKPNKT